MLEISFIPYKELMRIRKSPIPKFKKLEILSYMCRLNALSAVKKAGSGHLGSSFSSIDLKTYLYFEELNILKMGLENPDRDIYFSSKGHDCPAHYSVLFAVGIIEMEKLLKLRKWEGLEGHPDVNIAGIEANSGSLGMGISKAKGMAYAKKLNNNAGRVIVMTGDGELQEGQIWESLQTVVHQKINNLWMIVDHNKIQTDKPVEKIIDLGRLQEKFSVFGWHVERVNGHNMEAISKAFAKLRKVKNKPKIIIADTIKGKGVSFMEGPLSLKRNEGIYEWHSGAPADEYYENALAELLNKINSRLSKFKIKPLNLVLIEKRKKGRIRLKDRAEKVVKAYGDALYKMGLKRKDIVVLDADLSADCGLRKFEQTFPERFIENGIAEQDMVSTAGGLALQGYLPIVNSFGSFLASRANEQIYNNATEDTKIIYVCHYSGLIPAGPGKSHQSLRDISLLGSLPNCVIIEPANAVETEAALNWCVNEAKVNCMMRLAISPSPRIIGFPKNYRFEFGKGTVLKKGKDVALFAYGPVMLNEALKAAELLEKKGLNLKIIDMPWLNKINSKWLESVLSGVKVLFVLDNHSIYGGLGDCVINSIVNSRKLKNIDVKKLGIDKYPAYGTPDEVLRYHGLDGESLLKTIVKESLLLPG